MKVTGVIMECNPFHEGHAYLLKEARRQTGADYIIVAMSGDYVQRGEPAVFDKYIRAGQILQAGADLVLELPLYAACGSAEYFARGAIALLDRLGVVTDLCFGSESGDTEYLMKCARMLSLAEGGSASDHPHRDRAPAERECASDNPHRDRAPAARECASKNENAADCCRENSVNSDQPRIYREKLQAGLRKGMTFPAARGAALEAAFGDHGGTAERAAFGDHGGTAERAAFGDHGGTALEAAFGDHGGTAERAAFGILNEQGTADCSDKITEPASGSSLCYPSSPNDLLAVEYCRALLSLESSIRPHAISRISVLSATERRKQLYEERKRGTFHEEYFSLYEKKLPEHPFAKDIPLFPLAPDDFTFQLLYALKMNAPEAESFSDVSHDLAERMRALMHQYTGYTKFRDLLKTRNLTLTRVSRSLLHLLLGIKKEDMARLQSLGMAPYARPLAINRSARPLFSGIKKNASIPYIPKLSSASSILRSEEMRFLEEEIRAEELYTMTLAAVFSRETNSSAVSPKALRRPCVFLEKER